MRVCWNKIGFATALFLILVSCTRREFITLEEQVKREYTIAVVLPLGEGKGEIWHNSVDWALENMNASMITHGGIRINAEWYDEETEDMDKLFSTLSAREDISAIVGPLYSRNSDIAAKYCAENDKVLFPALSTSAKLMRAYAGKGFLWCLAENDISQCELLLSRAMHKRAESVSLLSSDDAYGQTFIDWFAFQAKELGLQVDSIEIYSNKDEIEDKLRGMMQSDTDCTICVPNDDVATECMNNVRVSMPQSHPFLFFSDGAYLTVPDSRHEGMEGIAQIYDPDTGFHLNFEAQYGIAPQYGNAHFYDAVILAGLAIYMADMRGDEDIIDCLKELVSMEGNEMRCCSYEGVEQIVKALSVGNSVHVVGASGKLRFSKEFTNVLHSVYCHWMVYQGKHLILEYNTSDSDNRTDASAANWNWRVKNKQEFSLEQGFSYPDKQDLYALIIASSSGWSNYRHQANAYAMYDILLDYGMDKDKILMVAEDDLAEHNSNPYKGSLRLSDDGENIYLPDAADYKPSQISWSEFSEKMTAGEIPNFTPDSNSNLLVYWSGHGTQAGLNWLESTVNTNKIAEMFAKLSGKNRFRKALLFIETCYSGNLGQSCHTIPGLLCITAANEDETSKADRYSPFYGTWMSNSFSEVLLEEIRSNPHSTLYDLYTKLYNNTLGSHVSVYNAEYFDNLYSSDLSEFLLSGTASGY